VFGYLGIEDDAFLSAEDYAKWLGRQSGLSVHMSNLMEIVFAVATLKDNGTFPETAQFQVSFVIILQIFHFVLKLFLQFISNEG